MSDPDSRHIKANEAYVQGYNAQAVVDENSTARVRASRIARFVDQIPAAGAGD